MATIREVARLAGVSPATVSRVMNGTANVDEEKRRRVLEAIEQTGFHPNELARALFKNSSKIVGLIVPNIENPFFSELAREIEAEAFQHGFRLLLCNSNNNAEKERMNISMLKQMKADGLILITNNAHTGRLIADLPIPVVVVDRHVIDVREIASVESDHYKGGRLATQHLIDCGCRKIVCFRGPQEFTSGALRFQGYRDICEENGLPVRYIDCEFLFEAGMQAAEEMLERYPDADGVVAGNDMVAISAYKVFRNHGIRVPEDIQLVGYDDISFSSLVSPEITTIHQPIREMGRRAIQLIYHYGNEQNHESELDTILDVQLIERQTTRKK